MAKFEGTIEEFIKFIGGYSRNKVQYITRSYRNNKGKCEVCGSRTKKLDAAHLKGKDRPIIISNILNNFIEDDIIKIDLQEFEDLYVQAHTPLKGVIKILCKKCHGEYDNLDIYPYSDPEVLDDVDLEKNELEEIKIVSELVLNSKMNKSKAIDIINAKSIIDLKNKKAIYSNINNVTDVWWLEPSNDKFKNGFFMILNDSVNSKLNIFEIPKNIIKEPKLKFDQRSDRVASKIIINTYELEYKDKNGFSFKPYLIEEIKY